MSTTTLPVIETACTLQGEGAFQGHSAYFIRLAGCDVGCVWCDTKKSWNIADGTMIGIDEIALEARASGCPLAVITGGEPTMHDLSTLTERLQKAGLQTHIETSGVYPLTGKWDWICFSPKKFKTPSDAIYTQAHELKVVICRQHDFRWAEQQSSKVSDGCTLFLQPEWSQTEQIMPSIMEYIKKQPKWKLSLQTHKYIDIP